MKINVNWGKIGQIAGEIAAVVGLVALDQTVRSWVANRVKLAFDKKAASTETKPVEDKGIAVQPVEYKAQEPEQKEVVQQ
jgi:hypothetical protein